MKNTFNKYLLVFFFSIFSAKVCFCQDLHLKDIASFKGWTVAINYKKLQKPFCQVYAPATSENGEYIGFFTIFNGSVLKESHLNDIAIDVGIVAKGKEIKLVLFNKNDIPIIGTGSKKISLGIVREEKGRLLFIINKEKFKKMISPQNKFIFALVKKSLEGKMILISRGLDGLEDACFKCGF